MTTIERIKRRLGVLEDTSQASEQKVTVEKCGDLELVKWGRSLIVKILRGCSMDDL